MGSIPQVNPNIILGGQQPAQPNALDSLARVLQIKGGLAQQALIPGQQQLQQQQVQEGQLKLDQTKALNDAYKSALVVNPDGSNDIDSGRLMQSLAASGVGGSQIPAVLKGVTDYKKGIADLADTQAKVAAAHADNGGALGSAVKAAGYDPNLFLTLTQHGITEGAIDPKSAAPYIQAVSQAMQQDPTGASAKQLVQKLADTWIAQSPKQQELSTAAQTAQSRAKTADTGEARLNAELPGITAGNTAKQQQVTGTEPIQPVQAATIAATNAGRAETARHNTVDEQQGAQRAGIEGQRLALQRQQLGFELNGDVSPAAQMAAQGRMDPQTLRALIRKSPGIVKQIQQIDPAFDEANIDNRYNALKEFTNTSASKAGGQMVALNTLIHHADLYQQVADSLKNGSFIPGNGLYNQVAQMFGSAPPTTAPLVARFLAGETGKVASGGVPAEGEINGVLKSLGSSSSPEQIKQAGDTLIQIAAGRAIPLIERAKQAKIDQVVPLLGEDAKSILQKRGFDPNTLKPTTSLATVPTPAAQAEFDALPRGAQFKKPGDPATYIKQ